MWRPLNDSVRESIKKNVTDHLQFGALHRHNVGMIRRVLLASEEPTGPVATAPRGKGFQCCTNSNSAARRDYACRSQSRVAAACNPGTPGGTKPRVFLPEGPCGHIVPIADS